mmetsp:Transcript_22521/g.53117  ORF Transcript_22521/g.53117 Transcript_22521/m.53117 type:complete len:231 (+) Transcript_22521:1437-2129(+)
MDGLTRAGFLLCVLRRSSAEARRVLLRGVLVKHLESVRFLHDDAAAFHSDCRKALCQWHRDLCQHAAAVEAAPGGQELEEPRVGAVHDRHSLEAGDGIEGHDHFAGCRGVLLLLRVGSSLWWRPLRKQCALGGYRVLGEAHAGAQLQRRAICLRGLVRHAPLRVRAKLSGGRLQDVLDSLQLDHVPGLLCLWCQHRLRAGEGLHHRSLHVSEAAVESAEAKERGTARQCY